MKTVYVLMEDETIFNEYGNVKSCVSYPFAVYTSKEEAEKMKQKLQEEEKARIRECEDVGCGTALELTYGIEPTRFVEK